MSDDTDPVSQSILRRFHERSLEGRKEQRLERFEKRKKQWEKATAAMLEALPEEYEVAVEQLLSADYFFRNNVAQYLEPKLNWKLARCPQSTYSDKKKTATWLNLSMAKLGLAIHCHTNQPPVILTVEQGNNGRGILHFDTRTEPLSSSEAPAYSRLETFDSIPEIHLRPTNLHRPQWESWTHLEAKRRKSTRDR